MGISLINRGTGNICLLKAFRMLKITLLTFQFPSSEQTDDGFSTEGKGDDSSKEAEILFLTF